MTDSEPRPLGTRESFELRIQLLSVPSIGGRGREPRYLERKAAAFIAYLALEGSTAKQKLARLLWPESSNDTARSNLRQLIRRLRLSAGGPCVRGQEVLSLLEEIPVDVLLLIQGFNSQDYASATRFAGELLSGCTYDDCPDLDDWVRIQRERTVAMQCKALEAEALRLQEEGRIEQAIEAAQQLLKVDVHSEGAYRLLMSLYSELGDRASALGVYQQCRAVLRRELDVEPSAETARLAREIRGGGLADSRSR